MERPSSIDRSSAQDQDAASGDVFTTVFVCTGNRARSALAEALFRRHTPAWSTVAASAGTLDVGPLPALPDAVDAGRRLGVDLTRHEARPLGRVDLSAADLVLGFEPFHVSVSIAAGDADPARAFLLGELVGLLRVPATDGGGVEVARALVRDADSRRTRHEPDRSAKVVRDPLGKSSRTMRRTAADIDELVRGLVLGLFGRPVA